MYDNVRCSQQGSCLDEIGSITPTAWYCANVFIANCAVSMQMLILQLKYSRFHPQCLFSPELPPIAALDHSID